MSREVSKNWEVCTQSPNLRPQDRTHCPRGHIYDEANTRIVDNRGYKCRRCRACEAMREAGRNQSQKFKQWYEKNKVALSARRKAKRDAAKNSPARKTG